MNNAKNIKIIAAALLIPFLFLTGCGGSKPEEELSDPTVSSVQASAPSETKIPGEARENIVTIGLISRAHGSKEIKKDAEQFNLAQSQYTVEIAEYDSYDAFITDIVRRQGADIFSLWDLPAEMLTQKGVLEDLTPYFAESDIVRQEDIAAAVWRAGTVEGKMTCLIPSFAFEAIVTEKGHTQNGGWRLEDYLALAEKYPGGM